MTRAAITSLLLSVAAGGCTLFSRAVPCDDDSDCPAPLTACVDAHCVEEPRSVCGNGVVDGDEACDDGNDDDTDSCIRCISSRCGDGFIESAEEACDDGNEDDTDGCINCGEARCGDGFIQAGVEACDDGNFDDSDNCVGLFCTTAECGDGFVHAGEEACDDGNDDDTDNCVAGCLAPVCGDGYVHAPPLGAEECDDADPEKCSGNCQLPRFDLLLRTNSSGCSGVAVVNGETVILDDGVTDAPVPLGADVTFIADVGCVVTGIAGCTSVIGDTCSSVVGPGPVEVAFDPPTPVNLQLSGTGDVRVTDAVAVGGTLVVVGDRDGTVSNIATAPPAGKVNGYGVAFAASSGPVLSVDAQLAGNTTIGAVVASGGNAVLVGTTEFDGGDLGGCPIPGPGAFVAVVAGGVCNDLRGISVPSGTITVAGAARDATALWVIAEAFSPGPLDVGDTTVSPGGIVLRVGDGAQVTVIGLAQIVPTAIAVVDGGVVIAGTQRGSITTCSTTTAAGDAIIALIDPKGRCIDAVRLASSTGTVDIDTVTARGRQVLAGGTWTGPLAVDGGGSPRDASQGIDGFVLDVSITLAGGFGPPVMYALTGSSEDRIIDLFVDDRSIGALVSTTGPATFDGSPFTVEAGTHVVILSPGGRVRRADRVVVVDGRPARLVRGSGSVMHIVGDQGGPFRAGFVVTLGQP